MKKLAILYLIGLTYTQISLSMFIKKSLSTPQYLKSCHLKTQTIPYIRNILKINQFKGIENDNDEYYDHLANILDNMFADLFVRNKEIIDLLSNNNDLAKHYREKQIDMLKAQQNLAAKGLFSNIKEIYEIEQKLHHTFKVEKNDE